MTVALTSNFLANARGITLKDSASVTWAINASTNELTATAAGGSGLTSVGLSDGSGTPIYTVGNSPLVANGTLTLTLNTQAQKTFFAGPTSGANAQPTFRVLAVADVPTLNQNTTGTAAGLSVTLIATSGGTGQSAYAVGDLLYADTTTTLARRADVAAGSYLRSGGVNTAPVWSTVTLPNTATQGDLWYANAANAMTALADVAAGSYLRSGGVGANPVWSTVTIPNAATLGDLWYGSAASAVSALAGTISATKQFLTQTGNGSISAAPVWGTIAAGDLPANGANPTASLGLAAVNGSATTWMRSDGAPALSQAIVPTWTGAHTFSALLTANLGITVAGATLKVAVGTATLAPLTFQSGTNLTSALAGVAEYDGTSHYFTNETTSGRGLVPVEQFFHLAAAGTGITTIANFFGTTSNISLVANAFYEIEIVCFFAMGTTGSVVTWSLINSAAPTDMELYYEMCPATGVVAPPGTATMLVGQIVNGVSATTTVVTASLTLSTKQYCRFRIMLKNGTGTSLKIQCAETTTTTPLVPSIGSYWRCKRIPSGNVGTFAA